MYSVGIFIMIPQSNVLQTRHTGISKRNRASAANTPYGTRHTGSLNNGVVTLSLAYKRCLKFN